MPTFDTIVSRSDVQAVIPPPSATEIISAVGEQSVALSLFNRVTMGSLQHMVATVADMPDAYWVNGDTGLKQTTGFSLEGVTLTAEELAVLVAIPNAVIDDAEVDLWAWIRPQLAQKFGRRIDLAALAGVDKPATWPQAIIPAAAAAGNVVTADSDAAAGGIVADLGAAFGVVEGQGFDVTGVVGNRPLRALLRGARDSTGQPLTDVATGFAQFEGNEIAYAPAGALGDNLAVVGDFRNAAVFGLRQAMTYTVSTEGVVSDENGAIVLNALQMDSTILRVVMRVAYAAAIPATDWAEDGFPFAVLAPGS